MSDHWRFLLVRVRSAVFGVLSADCPSILETGTVLVTLPLLICTGFVYCHCIGRWKVLDNTHGIDSGALR